MIATRKTTRRNLPRGHAATLPRGFTLFELLIVVGIIIMVLSITLPSIIGMLVTGADTQAYNMLAGQLMAARAVSIESETHVAVHSQTVHQLAIAEDKDMETACFSAVTWIDPEDSGATVFTLADGYGSVRMPGTTAFGEISSTFVNGSNFQLNANADAEGLPLGTGGLADFTAFSILFNPRGEVVKRFNGGTIQFHANLAGSAATDLWLDTHANGEEGVSTVTLFDYGEAVALDTSAAQQTYLDDNSYFLFVSTYTGRLSSRDTRGE